MSTSRRVATNTAILYLRMAITVLLSLYTTRITLTALGAEDFGIFSVVGGAILMLSFLNASMAAATQRFMSVAHGMGEPKRLQAIFRSSWLLHAAAALIIVPLLQLGAYILFGGILKIPPDRIVAAHVVYQCAVGSIVIGICSAPYDAAINSHENMIFVAITGIIESGLKLWIAKFIATSTGDRLIEYGYLTLAVVSVISILKLLYCHRNYMECTLREKWSIDGTILRQMTSFAGWSLLGSSTSIVSNYGQAIVLNTFFGTKVNAAQAISGQVSGQLGALATTMMRALNPIIAKSEGAGNRSLMLRASVLGSKMSFILLMILYVPVFVKMPTIFAYWLHDVPAFTVVFCRLLLIRNLVEQFYVVLSGSVQAVGEIRAYQSAMAIANLAPLVVTYSLFINGYSPTSLYIVYLCHAALGLSITLYFARIKCNLSVKEYLESAVLRCIAAFGAALLLTWALSSSIGRTVPELIGILTFGVATAILMAYYIGLTLGERLLITRTVGSLLQRRTQGT